MQLLKFKQIYVWNLIFKSVSDFSNISDSSIFSQNGIKTSKNGCSDLLSIFIQILSIIRVIHKKEAGGKWFICKCETEN